MATNAETSSESLTIFPFSSIVNGAYRVYNHNDGSKGETTKPISGDDYILFQNDFVTPCPSFPFPFSESQTLPRENGDGSDDDAPPNYSSPETVFAMLVIFSAMTIFGNSLVMLAVAKSHYLKLPPNYFVASLAAADFFVGILLLPFEAITQLLNRKWIFGEVWCDLWHSLDVLLTTASILNLCVISLDRYWAICTPFHYSRLMTPKRAFRFIALVWICSVVISLPAIFWWRGVRSGPMPRETCLFTDDVSYLISSSCISFYIPCGIILFAYYKIYLAAVSQSKSIEQGRKQLSSNDKNGAVTLRMHRGGTGNSLSISSSNPCSNSGTSGGGGTAVIGIVSNSNNGKEPQQQKCQRKSISFERAVATADPTGLSLLNAADKRPSLERVIIGKNGIMKRFGNSIKRKGRRAFSDSTYPPEDSSTGSSVGGIITESGNNATTVFSSGLNGDGGDKAADIDEELCN